MGEKKNLQAGGGEMEILFTFAPSIFAFQICFEIFGYGFEKLTS